MTSTLTATPAITPTQLARPFPKLLAEISLAPPGAHLTDLLLVERRNISVGKFARLSARSNRFFNRRENSPSLAEDGLVLLTADPYLYRSTDLGASWRQVLSTTGGLKAIVFSPAFSQTGVVYAYSDAEIWRSQDRGQNWRLVLCNGKQDGVRTYHERWEAEITIDESVNF